jgi:hypothetical protein
MRELINYVNKVHIVFFVLVSIGLVCFLNFYLKIIIFKENFGQIVFIYTVITQILSPAIFKEIEIIEKFLDAETFFEFNTNIAVNTLASLLVTTLFFYRRLLFYFSDEVFSRRFREFDESVKLHYKLLLYVIVFFCSYIFLFSGAVIFPPNTGRRLVFSNSFIFFIVYFQIQPLFYFGIANMILITVFRIFKK